MPEAVVSSWHPTSAWDHLGSVPSRGGRRDEAPGVTINLIDHADMAMLICAEGQRQRFAETVKAFWGLDVPECGRTSANDACTLVWSGRAQVLAAPRRYDLAEMVARFAGIAAVTDQGDGRALVEIGGVAARRALAKGLAIDLDPAVFSPGCVAVTALSHISVHIWQVDAAPTYVLSVPRTVAAHIWDWLCVSAAEFGYEVGHRSRL